MMRRALYKHTHTYIHIYRTFHPQKAKYTSFSYAYETFFKIDHILGHKTYLHKVRSIEIVPTISSDHDALK